MNKQIRILGAVILLLQLTVPASECWATSFFQRPFSTTIQEAPVIVRGKVGASYSDWGVSADGQRRQIYTFYDLQVDEVMKGTAQKASIQIRELGGEKDGVGMQVAGASRFERGEDVVVMLSNRNPDGTHDVYGLMMAKLDVKLDGAGREVLDGPALDPVSGDAQQQGDVETGGQADTSNRGPWTVSKLRKLIADQASGGVVQNPSGNSTPAPSQSPSPSPGKVAKQAAPQLQPSPGAGTVSPPEDESRSSDSSSTLPWVLGALAFVLAGWGILRATRHKK